MNGYSQSIWGISPKHYRNGYAYQKELTHVGESISRSPENQTKQTHQVMHKISSVASLYVW